MFTATSSGRPCAFATAMALSRVRCHSRSVGCFHVDPAGVGSSRPPPCAGEAAATEARTTSEAIAGRTMRRTLSPRGAAHLNSAPSPRPRVPDRRSSILPFAAFIACSLIWGSTWLAIKEGYESMPPITAAAIRFSVATAILIPAMVLARAPLPRGRREWGAVAFVGIMQMGIDYALIYWAEQSIASGLTAVLFAPNTVMTALIAAGAGLEAFSSRKILGGVLSVVGVGVLFSDQLDLGRSRTLPMLAVLGGALCSAASNVVAKRHAAGVHRLTLTALSMAIGTSVLYASALAAGEEVRLPATAKGWWVIAYLAAFGSVAGFMLLFWLLKRWQATHVS